MWFIYHKVTRVELHEALHYKMQPQFLREMFKFGLE